MVIVYPREGQKHIYEGKQGPVSTTSVMKSLDICLDNNYFEFDGKIYRQHGGVAIGPKMSPPYACLGLGDLEEKILSAENQDLDKLLLWKRFIDDVWSLFRGSYDEAKMFVNWLNSLLPGVIKFTFEY